MRVLHYIRDIDGVTLNMPYSLMSIVLSTSKVTETHLLTFSQLSEERLQMLKEQYGVTVPASWKGLVNVRTAKFGFSP